MHPIHRSSRGVLRVSEPGFPAWVCVMFLPSFLSSRVWREMETRHEWQLSCSWRRLQVCVCVTLTSVARVALLPSSSRERQPLLTDFPCSSLQMQDPCLYLMDRKGKGERVREGEDEAHVSLTSNESR